MAKKQAAPAKALPPMPGKYKLLGKGNFPPVFAFEKVGDTLEGRCQQVKLVPKKKPRKGESKTTRIMYIADSDGEVRGVWESKALEELFNTAQAGDGVYIRYEGEKDVGQKQPMHDFTTGHTPKGKGKK